MVAAVEAERTNGELLPEDTGKSQEVTCLFLSVNEVGATAGVCASAKCTNRPVWTIAAQPSRTAAFFAFFRIRSSALIDFGTTRAIAPIILSHLCPRISPVASERALGVTKPKASLAPPPKDPAAQLPNLSHAIVIIPSAGRPLGAPSRYLQFVHHEN